MKKLKKLCALLMCGIMSLSFIGCGGGGTSGDSDDTSLPEYDKTTTTVIEVAVHNGGVRWEWLEKAFLRFQEQQKDVS